MIIGIKHAGWALLFTAAVLSPSCHKRHTPDVNPEEQTYTVSLEAGFEALSRADVSSSTGAMTWGAEDRIAVGLDDGTFVPFDLVSGAGETAATFSGSIPGNRIVSGKAYFPWWDGAYSTADPRICPPATQEYVSDTYAPAVMSADIVSGEPLSFKHDGGVLRFTIKGIPSTAVKFTFSSEGGVYGNDNYSITFPAGGASTRVFSVPVKTGTLSPYTISLSTASSDVLVSQGKSSSTDVERCQLRIVTPLEVVLTNNFRVVSYNILNGMEADYDNDYDNFVSWVKSVSPDVLVLCEAKPFDKSADENSNAAFFRTKMVSRAARWGHGHVAIVNNDNYPIVITSSSSLSVHSTLTGSKTKHGAIHVSTRGYDIVGVHLQPTLDTGFDLESTDKYEYYGAKRVEEWEYILENTLIAYPDRTSWIFAGDFNSYSYLEKSAISPYGGKSAWTYPDYQGSRSAAYDVYDAVTGSGITDALYSFNGGAFQPTMYHGCSRIDYFFVSTGVYSRIKRAVVLRGGFPGDYSSGETTPNPSDHFPVLIDIADYSFRVLDGNNTINDWAEDPIVQE